MTTAASDRFRLVVLCTGNRARSPVAGAFLTQLTAHLPVDVETFGTLALPPTPALPEAVEAALRYGIDLGAHRSRCLGTSDLSTADLVVGFERGHVAKAVVDARADRARTFTLPELVELVERAAPPSVEDPVDRARAAVAAAHRLRPAPAASVLEVPDPIGQPPAFFVETCAVIERLSRRLAHGLFGASVAGLPWRRVA